MLPDVDKLNSSIMPYIYDKDVSENRLYKYRYICIYVRLKKL